MNQTVGIGGRYDFPMARLDASYLYVNGRTKTRYTYNADALALTPTQVALIGGGMPDLVFIQNIVQASLLVPIAKNVAARLYYNYESGSGQRLALRRRRRRIRCRPATPSISTTARRSTTRACSASSCTWDSDAAGDPVGVCAWRHCGARRGTGMGGGGSGNRVDAMRRLPR